MADDDDMAGETESGWCDVYDGGWVRDEEARPLYAPGTCPYVDEAYSCAANGRPDDGYTRWRWAPRHCSLPRYRAGRPCAVQTQCPKLLLIRALGP